MASTPRILTVDSSWTISRIVRGAMDLIDRAIIQIDVPSGTEALEEIKRGGINLVITDLELSTDMRGFELALRVSQSAPETHVIILADVDDPELLDDETSENSPFVYLHRPVEMHQFSRVVMAALDGKSMKEALVEPVTTSSTTSFGPVPALDLNVAQTIVDSLLSDLGAMAIVLSTRAGEVLMGRGAVGYVNNEKLSKALTPLVMTNIEFRDLVGGQASALQFYDGDTYDVFVLSVGMHHFLSVVFDGQIGSRQFGAVSRYGRRAAEDLIALLGAHAWMIQAAAPEVAKPEESLSRKKAKAIVVEEEPEVIELAKADFGTKEEAAPAEPEKLFAEPIANLDVSIFDQLDKLDTSGADDLFDLDKLGEMAHQQQQQANKGRMDYDEAVKIGIIPS
ncbi:MAG: response regulator [Anaerolineae bacterium]